MHRPRVLIAAAVLALPLIFVPTSPAHAATYTPSNWTELRADVAAATATDVVELGANITAPAGQRLEVAPGAALNLDLNGFTLTIPAAPNEQAAIRVPSTAQLDIRATGGGALMAVSGSSGAGIGGDHRESAGTVVIRGGTVTAKASGPGGGAGIGGGGAGGAGGTVTILGGVVTATSEGGEVGGAGIGGGEASPGGTVTISGGAVTATGGDGSPGVGGGAGIGGGGSIGFFMDGGAGASVTITGGSVTATGGTSPGTAGGGGAGIGGGGGGAISSGGSGGSVSVLAPATAYSHAAGGSGTHPTMGGVGATIAPGVSPTPGLYYTAAAVQGSVGGPAATVSIAFQFHLTFDSDGGTAVPDQFVDVGGFATEPAPPTRAGFEFTGWRVGGATGPEWDSSAAVDSALSLVATWQAVDRSGLLALVAGAVTDELDYTPASWAPYASALADAQAVLGDGAATQAEVDAARAALESAAGELVPRADFTGLTVVADLARALPANGTGGAEFDYDAWRGLGDAHAELESLLSRADAVLADLDSTQAEVDTAAINLLEQLILIDAGMALATTVAGIDALGLVETDYTPETWTTLQGAIGDAHAALDAIPLAGRAVLDPLDDAVLDAWSALESRPDSGGLPVTGPEIAPLAGGAVALVLLGALVLLLSSRRRGASPR